MSSTVHHHQTSPSISVATTPGTNSSGLSIGFIGFGTIAFAIAQGIVAQSTVPIQSMAVSRRSKRNSTTFQLENPGLVNIYDDPQDIVDASSDIVFLCVLPELVPDVLRQISFHKNGNDGRDDGPLLVSLVAGTSIEELSSRSKDLECNRIVKMICTPSIAQHEGITLLLRGGHDATTTDINDETKQEQEEEDDGVLSLLLTAMGGYQQCYNEQEMNVLMTGACVMGPMYALMKAHIDWLEQQKIPKDVAHKVVTKQYSAIVNDTLVVDKGDTDGQAAVRDMSEDDTTFRVQRLLAEQTPNGINEQAKQKLTSLGAVSSYTQILDLILDRLESKTK